MKAPGVWELAQGDSGLEEKETLKNTNVHSVSAGAHKSVRILVLPL